LQLGEPDCLNWSHDNYNVQGLYPWISRSSLPYNLKP